MVFAVAAAPCYVFLLALWIIEKRKFLTVWERLSLSISSPVPSRLHTVRGEVFIFWWAVLAAEQARSCIAFSAFRIASLETCFFIWCALPGGLA